ESSFGGQTFKTSVSPTALLPALKEFPEIEEGVRVYNPAAWNPYIVRKDDKLFQEEKVYFADSAFFDVFSFELLKGNPKTVLTDPYSLILTESSAKKYFGNEDPVGKTLLINNSREYIITGLMKDVPSNSFFKFDFLASFSSLRVAREQPIWWSANFQTFVVLHENADVNTVASKTNEVVKRAVGSELTNPGDYVRYNFMKFTDIHLRSPYESEFEVVGNIQYVYIFSAIALLILLIACINYVNLATARAAGRAKEVGIRKVVGAHRGQLFGQFMGESVLITFLAFFVAFVIALAILPLFNSVTGKEIATSTFYEPSFIATALMALTVIALLSGAYPAFAITGFRPVSILKGNFKFSGKGIWLRKILVVTQFCVSITLIIGTVVILKQLEFIQSKKLGYKKENVMILPLDQATHTAFNQLKTEFMRTGFVESVGRGTESPTLIRGGYGFNLESAPDNRGILVTAVAADTGFVPALTMELVQGRNFNEADFHRVETDTFYSFIVNESLLKTIYLEPEKALGTKVRLSGRRGEIVGVIRDFHYASLHSPIGPLVLFNQIDYNHMFVKISSSDMPQVVLQLKQICGKVIPQRPFEYEFLDQQYDQLYASEQRTGMIFTLFAALAVFIASLGLLGLVSFSAAQKTKEIGIRKVLGATAANIVLLITSDFTKLVIIAIAIGIPLAYWVMNQWLEDFAYRTTIGVWPVVMASALCLVIAFGTAGFQALKAALVDPAKTLRNE
ncbi:MAG TPA: FtsX-like permease family protein, partial [Chryseosolibacter sp.]|nr:FtsX-like permease family protein [Chryseosolibacter sp.]